MNKPTSREMDIARQMYAKYGYEINNLDNDVAQALMKYRLEILSKLPEPRSFETVMESNNICNEKKRIAVKSFDEGWNAYCEGARKVINSLGMGDTPGLRSGD